MCTYNIQMECVSTSALAWLFDVVVVTVFRFSLALSLTLALFTLVCRKIFCATRNKIKQIISSLCHRTLQIEICTDSGCVCYACCVATIFLYVNISFHFFYVSFRVSYLNCFELLSFFHT